MPFYGGSTYLYCRSESESGLAQRRISIRDTEPTGSGDSTLTDIDESESCSGSGQTEINPNIPYPGIAPIALGYLSQTTRPRSWCLALISNPWFERISMMVILLNCVTLGMYQPCVDDECRTNRCKILQVFDDFIFAFFALEMMIKMVAMGVWGPGSYLADSWNRLDLFIVLAGAFEYCLHVDNMNLSAIRTIRVLRPLRAINRIPSMRILVMLLLDTLPMLGNVLLLCFFVFFIFGIVGVQLWQGILRQRCYVPKGINITFPEEVSHYYKLSTELEYICTKRDTAGMHQCTNLPPYKEGNITCNLTYEQAHYEGRDGCVNWNQYYTTCLEGGQNPFEGTISFDNIGLAWVAIFLVISLEGWSDIMYYVQDAHSFWDWIYFVLLIVIGSFFMINLCLVVIATQFSETKKREMERMRMERARFQSTSTLASSTNNSEPTTCYAEIVKYIAHLYRRHKRKLMKKIRLLRYRRDQKREERMIAGDTIRLNFNRKHHPCCPKMKQMLSSSPSPQVVSSRTGSISAPATVENSSKELKQVEDGGEEMTTTSTATAIIPKRPSLLRVPSCTSNQDIPTNNTESPTNLLSPPLSQGLRRRSSVMFSDVILLHKQDGSPTSPCSSTDLLNNDNMAFVEKKNVCSSEKMTQTGDGNIWQITTNVNSGPLNQQQILVTQQQIAAECCDLLNGEAMTCQELLALGAINAALPTGQMPLMDTFFDTLSKGVVSSHPKSSHNDDAYVQQQQCVDDEFACCQELWGNNGDDYKDKKRSRLYVVICTIIKGIFRGIRCVRRHIRLLVEHKYFQQGILLAILINTLSMGIEYHKQPEELTAIVETSNVVFSAIFAVEMVLKVLSEGPFKYIANGFNVFDGVIVILSVVELCQKFWGDSHGDSGLSVLRTFRLLRILKLVRFMPNLRRQLFVMLRTMDNVAIFFSLLILFIFIFSILGMYLFGGKFCKYTDSDGIIRECSCVMIITKDRKCECDRKHFNDILWATVTVFQILTQEDWNIVLANGMSKTSHWAALYFVALMTFGNYVLFNLLVAILVEGFSAERNERREREQRELARKMSCMLEAVRRASYEDKNRSTSTSSDSIANECKNTWRSVDDLQKLKSTNDLQELSTGCSHCDLKAYRRKDSCYIKSPVLHAITEPKCNIQKESFMLKQPPRQNSPPIITHTAATPQDSPSTTLDDYPEFKYNVMCNEPYPVDEIINIENINRSANNNVPSFLKPPVLSPPPLTFRHFEKLPDDSKTVSSKIITHNERIGSKTTTFSEKVSIPVSTANKAANSQNQPQEKPKIQRGYSWKIRSRPSLRRKKNRSGSDSEAVPLNNGRDHSQCNGGNITRHASLRNDSLLQSPIRIQNDTQKDAPNNKNQKALSPQNSFRSRSNTCSPMQQISWMPSLTRQNSLTSQNIPQNKISPLSSSFTKNSSPTAQRKNSSSAEPKAINTLKRSFLDKSLPKISFEEVTAKAEQKVSRIKQFLLMVEPKGCMKEREEFSLYIFPPNNRFRQFCHWLVDQKWFDNVVLLFIAMNCITLAMERPNIPPKSTERLFLQSTNYIFTFVFAVEMAVKVVACGMCYGPDAYFTSGWNIMDGSLVIISIVDLLMSLISESSPRIFGILRVFRLLRSLRPLRVINRAPGLKLVVQTLLSSLRPIGNIVLICCTFFIIFGILGVQLFKGSFYYCTGRNITGVRNRTDCLSRSGNSWVNQKYNFDDLGKALMSLFVLSSKDGWVNIMYTGLDAVGEDLQPIINYSEWRLLYFIAFILLVGFFVLNMFVGVVVENFHRCREEQEKEERVRRAAKRALQLEKRRRKMNEPPYYINYSPWRLFIHNVVTSKYFDLAIAAVIGLNVVTMATESYKMPEILNYVLKIFNYFFTAVFILESTMKLTALGFKLYLKDKWNQLDVAIVILSVVGIVLEELKSNIIPINPTVLRVMRVMRIARVLKLLKMAKGIRALLDTVMQALPQVGNLGLLFFLLFFIFAALGVELFGRLECSDEHPCQGLGEHAHFANFGMAFLTLFRVATGDNWNGIMKDTLRDDCDDAADCVRNCCVSAVIAPLFFVIFVLMAQFVLVNVVVAVLMKHLEESHKHLEDEQDMDNQLEREFQEKQELEERRELCLALQLDSEFTKSPKKTLTKVLSLPANFTYNPPGSKERLERKPSKPRVRRQTLHSQQPITLNLENLDDIKVIDESTSDISRMLDLPSSVSRESLTTDKPKEKLEHVKNVKQTKEFNLLTLPTERKPVHKMFGSTKHLFQKQKSIENDDESALLLSIPSGSPNRPENDANKEKTEIELTAPKIFKHDSQESVHRIIKERRKLDETLKDVSQHDIFNTAQSSEERDSSRTSADHPSIEEEEEESKSEEVEHVC